MARTRETAGIGRWGAPLLSLVVLAGVAGLVVAAREHAALSPRFVVDPGWAKVELHPEWLPAALASALATELGSRLGPSASLLDDDDLTRWRKDLPDLSSWVGEVLLLEPRFPGQALVSLRLRRPVLALPGDELLAGDGEHLGRGILDSEPRPLRLEGFAEPADARECAAAAADLLPHRARLLEQGIPVDRVAVDQGGRVVFLTTEGVELEWGRSSTLSRFSAVDLPPASRISHLLSVLKRHPGLFGVQRVVLWKDQPEIVLAP